MRVALTALSCAALVALAAPACGDDAEALPAGCSVALSPDADAFEALQTAFLDALSGDTICLRPGTYAFTRELNLANRQNITLRGAGATRDEVVLDFAGQTVGNNGMTVTADGFAIENLTIKNSPGNGIVVQADTSRFTNIRVYWDAGSVRDNGAYAIYPNGCSRTIVEDSEVVGAADAGIYVGSCEYAIVRRNTVYANVAGIEIENSRYADVYENEVYDNTAGVLVFVLPNLAIKEVREVLVRDNLIYDNNRDNFAEPGTVVSFVPKGLGVLTMGAKDAEFRDNTITGNDSAGVLIVSFNIMEVLAGIENSDDEMDPYTERVYVHGNTFADNGQAPAGALSALGEATLPDVLWDGDVRDDQTDPEICLGATPPSFLDFDGPNLTNPSERSTSTDTTPHACTLPPLETLTSFEDMEGR